MKTLYYLKRAISLPPHIVAQKLMGKLKTLFEHKKNRWLDEKFPTYQMKFPPLKNLQRVIERIELTLLPKEEIAKLCNRYLNHEFDLLGSGWIKVFHGVECKGVEGIRYLAQPKRTINGMNQAESERIRNLISNAYLPIDWHIDFKSGYRWHEDVLSQEIRYGSDKGADVKVPWELSRMQHLVMLAWGYALESDPKYHAEFKNQILDFIAENPPRYGVNWVCTMDVGIRIANWLLSYDLFKAYGASFDEPFENIFHRSVHEHGHHIFTHLEWDPLLRSNHYLANIAGLLFVALYLNHENWLTFSLRELESETLLQFHPDGSNFEASTSYHRLSAEMVVYATALALETGRQFSQEHLDRIQKMAAFIRDITKPDGKIVQFGDNDSGRFLKVFPDVDGLDHGYLIRAIRGLKNLTTLMQNQLGQIQEKGKDFCSYSDFGLYIQKKGVWFLAVRCGSIGQRGNGGHAHNDQLSFELAVKGVSMIIDPGTYVYTPLPEARRRFRSTFAHNTLAIEGKEQNKDEGLFRMTDKASATAIRFEEGLFIGEHRGFGQIHRRTLQMSEKSIVGIDECDCGPKQIYFHLAPDWNVKLINSRECQCSKESITVRIKTEQGSMKLFEGEYSRAYGKNEKIPGLVIAADAKSIPWKILV